MKELDRNYFIKPNYIANKSTETIESENKFFWTEDRILQSFYTRYYLFKNIKNLIEKFKLRSILDIGCGPAYNLMKILYPLCNEIYGIDQPRIINFCKKRYGITTFYADDIENSTLNINKNFDLIICTDVIEHLLNPDKLIDYIKKFSHSNTFLIITTPERDILRGKNCNFCPKPSHIREWNKYEFNKYLKSNGFRILYNNIIESFRILIYPKKPLNEIISDLSSLINKTMKFNTLRKIKHSQLAVCKLSTPDDLIKRKIEKIFKNNVFRDIMNILLIKSYLYINFLVSLLKDLK